jgi:hypothetical protein
MRRPVSAGCDTVQWIDALEGAKKRRPAMKKTGTVRVNGNMIFKGHKLTIGVDLGDRWSNYCVLDEAGEILLEQVGVIVTQPIINAPVIQAAPIQSCFIAFPPL